MATKAQQAKLKEAIKDMFASQDVLVLKALDTIEKHGDESVIMPMLEVLVDAEGEVKTRIETMLSSLKISAAEPSLVSALGDERFAKIEGDILSFLWHSRFEPVDSIDEIAKAAMRGDFNTALEAMTLIENMEGPYPDDKLMEAITSLSEHIVANKKEEKAPLLIQMQQYLSAVELNQ